MELRIGNRIVAKSERFTLYIVDKDREGRLVNDIELWIEQALKLLSIVNGGATRLAPAVGCYLVNGRMIRETMHIVYSDIRPGSFASQLHLIRRYVYRLARATRQDTVSVEFNGVRYLIRATAEEQWRTA